MPKIKTKKSAAKRFKKTASGKFLFARPGRGHLLTSKNRKRKRNLGKAGTLCKAETAVMAKMLPY